jgi:hypothetical protein
MLEHLKVLMEEQLKILMLEQLKVLMMKQLEILMTKQLKVLMLGTTEGPDDKAAGDPPLPCDVLQLDTSCTRR